MQVPIMRPQGLGQGGPALGGAHPHSRSPICLPHTVWNRVGDRGAKKSLQHLGCSTAQKRELSMILAAEYPISLLCQALDLARSSYYYHTPSAEDPVLREALLRLAEVWPTYGYRRLTAQLRREGWEVNGKRVRRLMRALGLRGARKRTKRQTTDSDHTFPRYPNLVQDLEIVFPEQVWVADITYVHLLTEFVYLAVIMDVFTRGIRGWHLGRNLDQELTLTALERALQERCPLVHHSDQGVQYAAAAYVEMLQGHGVAISMADLAPPGKTATPNA
ncbi:MAG: IS3 family transposase [Synergistales bacterium]|nr:IS3 family transposase [Synergistales bacterium]